MSPFADYLHEFRMRHGIRQTELAKILGYEQGYISALELDKKGPPTEEFTQKLIKSFNFTPQEILHLNDVIDASNRKIVISNDVSKEAYWLIRDIREYLPVLTKAEIDVLRRILTLKKDMLEISAEIPRQLKRRVNEEVKM
jgi:transcriptional regulator with XRE-family HTH domain